MNTNQRAISQFTSIPRPPRQVPPAAPAQPLQQCLFQVQAAPQAAAAPVFPVNNLIIIKRFISNRTRLVNVLRLTTFYIQICIRDRNLPNALYLFQNLKDNRIQADVIIYSALISACEKSKNLDKALELYADMKASGIQADVIIYSALISACEKSKNLDKALELYADMKSSGIQADVITYSSLIAACKSVGNIQKAIEFLQLGVADGVYQQALGFSQVGPDIFRIDFHEPSIVSAKFISGNFRHPKGVDLSTAEAVLIYHLRTKKFHASSVKIELVVGCHGDGTLRDGIRLLVNSSFFSGLFGKVFSYSLEQDRGNSGRLNLFLTRKS